MQYIALFICALICLALHKRIITMKETISLRLESELLKFLKTEAEGDFRSVNNYIEMILQKHKLEKQKETPTE